MEPLDLTASILARTTGTTCPRLRELACAYVDGELPPLDVQLVEGHAAHCPGCRATLAALRESHARLPVFARAEPGPYFAARVLRACRQTPPPSFWARLVDRPRMALEGAFVGVALGALALTGAGVPVKPALGLVTRGLHGVAQVVRAAQLHTEPPTRSLR